MRKLKSLIDGEICEVLETIEYMDAYLVRGKTTGLEWYVTRLHILDGAYSWLDAPPQAPKPKCECGTSITMGPDDAPEYHSDWCPVSPNYKPA